MSNQLQSVEQAAKQLISIMEQGVNPWVKPWKSSNNIYNPVSKKPFTGFNYVMLSLFGGSYTTGFWVTYKQADSVGGNVKEGMKGISVIAPLMFEKEVNGVKETFCKGFREYKVFNLDQCENVSELYPKDDSKPIERLEHCEATIRNTGAKIVSINSNSCYYSSKEDIINMVDINKFHNNDVYYATAFHELSHWTGNEKRLDRKLGNIFGSSDYAFEELIAELSANFLCNHHGIDGVDSHNAAYLKSWIKALQDDSSVILKAAGQAQKAANYILKTA